MKNSQRWDLLCLFGTAREGGEESTPVHTPQAIDSGEIQEQAALAAGEPTAKKPTKEEFRALMEGEYKELFTAYFQETFNRRFKEQREMKEELEHARSILAATAAHFGVPVEELGEVIRTENERKQASAKMTENSNERAAFEEELRAAVESTAEKSRAEAERAVLAAIRERQLRPVESALTAGAGRAVSPGSAHLSRAQRADVARRAAKGEHIRF